MNGSSAQNRRVVWLSCLGLVLGTLLAYSPLFRCDFISYDDPDYVTHNPHVERGLTAEGISWAFVTRHTGNWHPLTWISHMADCQVYGLSPGGHHFSSLLLHVANTLLLFGVLRRLTGALWRSALVAALFAWHPLHVESVAWVSERKDVLSAFFWFLALGAYGRYAEKSKVQGPKSEVRGFYLLALLFFVLGLLSKPMVVTLPFVLLLLDYWPLQRSPELSERSVAVPWSKLVWEKLPFFLLAAIASTVTFFAQKSGGAVSSLHDVTFPQRLANAPIACIRYLRKMFWPSDLAIIYPLRDSWAVWQIIGAAFLLAAITLLAVATRRSRPYLFIGWLWFLGMLVPVIGLVQVGRQSMADRYTYLPLVGVFIMLVWAAADWLQCRSKPKLQVVPALVTVLLIGCTGLTWFQARTWRNSTTLFTHALAVKAGGAFAHADLGAALAGSGRLDEAVAEYEAALKLKPGNPIALLGLGLINARQGKDGPAMDYFGAALRSRPDYAEARYNIGLLLAAQGKTDEAIEQYKECLRLLPDVSEAHYSLANALVAQGKLAEAADHYRASLRLEPDAADAHNNLGAVLLHLGQPAEAVEQFQAALKLRPDFAEAEDQLGGALQKLGRGEEARRHFARAVQLRPDLAHARLKLGLLLAQQQQFDQARGQLERAVELEPTNDVAWYNLAGVLAAQGQWAAAARDFGKVLELKPGDVEAHARLGAVLAQAGQGAAAIAEYERAAQLSSHREPRILAALDQAYAQAGRWAEAIQTAQAAQAAAEALQQPALAEEAARRLERYRAGHGQE